MQELAVRVARNSILPKNPKRLFWNFLSDKKKKELALNFVREHVEKAKAAGLTDVPVPEQFKAHPHPEGKNRRWRRAEYGPIQRARFRKICLQEGVEWPWERPLYVPGVVV